MAKITLSHQCSKFKNFQEDIHSEIYQVLIDQVDSSCSTGNHSFIDLYETLRHVICMNVMWKIRDKIYIPSNE